jgi:hypothetical protein
VPCWILHDLRRTAATSTLCVPGGTGWSLGEHLSQSGVMQRRELLTSEAIMGGLIYLIGLIVVVLFILSFLGLR